MVMFQPRSVNTTALVYVYYCYVTYKLAPPPTLVLYTVPMYLSMNNLNPWSPTYPLPLPGSFFHLDVARVPLSVRLPQFNFCPSAYPTWSWYLCCPTCNDSYIVVLMVSDRPPCLHHRHLFLLLPSYKISHVNTYRSSCRATHCATGAYLWPM